MQDSEFTDPSDTPDTGPSEARPDHASKRRYSSEEVADIIRLSLKDETRHLDNSVDYEELLAIAREVGVDAENVDRAVHLLEEEQSARDKEQYLWSRFRTHCILFIGVNLLCIAINVLSNSDTFWSMYVLFGWGLFLLGHYAGLRYAPQFVELAMERTQSMANNKYQEFFADDGNVGFSLGDPMGLTETKGLVSLEDSKLLIEYQTLDSMLGVWKSRVKVVEIPLSDISAIRLERKLWSMDLIVQGRNMRALRNAPGSAGGSLRLKINCQSQTTANRLLQEARAHLQG